MLLHHDHSQILHITLRSSTHNLILESEPKGITHQSDSRPKPPGEPRQRIFYVRPNRKPQVLRYVTPPDWKLPATPRRCMRIVLRTGGSIMGLRKLCSYRDAWCGRYLQERGNSDAQRKNDKADKLSQTRSPKRMKTAVPRSSLRTTSTSVSSVRFLLNIHNTAQPANTRTQSATVARP